MDERTTNYPRQYHREANRLPWLLALRKLHRCGYSDREIAERLCALSAEAIRTLQVQGSWRWRHVEPLLETDAAPLPWTTRQVRWHRQQMGLRANRPRIEGGSLLALRQAHRRGLQREAGLGRLMPRKNDAKKEWEPGVELRPTEVRILQLLKQHGALSRAAIASCLGLKAGRGGLKTGREHYLSRLLRDGLIRVAGLSVTGCQVVRSYALADGILTDEPERPRETSIERRARELFGLN